MSRKLEEIRNNIAKRKTQKNKLNKPMSSSYNSLLEDEERHGFTSYPRADSSGFKIDSARSTKIMMKFLGAAIIVFLTLFTYQAQVPVLNQLKPVVNDVLTEDLPFATVQAWYDEHFATPFLSFGKDEERMVSQDVQSVPVSGVQMDHVKDYENGIFIEVNEPKNIYPLDRGTVLFAGKKDETGNTIIIQHEDGRKSVYGNLKTIDVFHYQFVSPGQTIGKIEPDELVGYSNMYFAVKEGNQFVDPTQFILGDMDDSE